MNRSKAASASAFVSQAAEKLLPRPFAQRLGGFSAPLVELMPNRRAQHRFARRGGASQIVLQQPVNTVAANLSEQGRDARVRCIFNEKDSVAAQDLADFVERVRPEFPHVEIHALTGSFQDNAPRIDLLAPHPFRLVFVDPTGWTGYPLDALTGR